MQGNDGLRVSDQAQCSGLIKVMAGQSEKSVSYRPDPYKRVKAMIASGNGSGDAVGSRFDSTAMGCHDGDSGCTVCSLNHKIQIFVGRFDH